MINNFMIQLNRKKQKSSVNSKCSRRNRKLREEKKGLSPFKGKREQILFETFDEGSIMSSEIQTSLAIIQQAKAQSKKYSGNRSSYRNSNTQILNNLGKGNKKESITQRYLKNQKEKDMNFDNCDKFLMKSPEKMRMRNIDISEQIENFSDKF